MTRTRWIHRAFQLVLLPAVASQLGCGLTGFYEEGPRAFSPNSERAAQVRVGLRTDVPPPDAGTLDKSVHVYLWDAARPNEWKHVAIERFAPRHNSVSIEFSPDSRRLAVRSLGGLFVIDCQSGKLRRLTPKGEYAESIRWCDPTELGYVSCQYKKDNHGCVYCPRQFWVQGVNDTPAQRRLVLDCQDCHWDDRYSWSPDGRSIVIFPDKPYPWRLVNVADGSIKEFGTTADWSKIGDDAVNSVLSWSSTGDEAVCLCFKIGFPDRGQFWKLNTRTKRVIDLMPQFRKSALRQRLCDDRGLLRLRLANLNATWQCGDSYLLFEDIGCLVSVNDFSEIDAQHDFGRLVPNGAKLYSWIGVVGRDRFLIVSAEDGRVFKVDCDLRTAMQMDVGRWKTLDDPKFGPPADEAFAPNGKYFFDRCRGASKVPNWDVFGIPEAAKGTRKRSVSVPRTAVPEVTLTWNTQGFCICK